MFGKIVHPRHEPDMHGGHAPETCGGHGRCLIPPGNCVETMPWTASHLRGLLLEVQIVQVVARPQAQLSRLYLGVHAAHGGHECVIGHVVAPQQAADLRQQL